MVTFLAVPFCSILVPIRAYHPAAAPFRQPRVYSGFMVQKLTCIGVGMVLVGIAAAATFSSVTTIVGTGTKGYSDTEVNNPYGMAIGPDGALYFCEVDNHRIRRLDLKTRRMTLIAGNGQHGYSGDGGPAVDASLNAPHELLFDAR